MKEGGVSRKPKLGHRKKRSKTKNKNPAQKLTVREDTNNENS